MHQDHTNPTHHQSISLKQFHSRLSKIAPSALGVSTFYSLKRAQSRLSENPLNPSHLG